MSYKNPEMIQCWNRAIRLAFPKLKYYLPYDDVEEAEKTLIYERLKGYKITQPERYLDHTVYWLRRSLNKGRILQDLRTNILSYNDVLSLDTEIDNLFELIGGLSRVKFVRNLTVQDKENIIKQVRVINKVLHEQGVL